MKRITIVSIVVAVIFVAGLIIVRAESRGEGGWCGGGWHRWGPGSYIAHELKLSDTQRTQVRALLQAERPIAAGRVHELLAENKELNAITVSDQPDQAAMQEVADREAATIASLLVAKAQLQATIYSTVLNPDQRTKAIEIQNKMESRLEHAAHRLDTPDNGRVKTP